MQFLIISKVFDTITGSDAVRMRHEIGPQIQKIVESGKMIAGGEFSGTRAGFLLIDVEGPEEIPLLLGNVFINHMEIEVHAILPLQKVAEVYEEMTW
jgi:hypothetical protein